MAVAMLATGCATTTKLDHVVLAYDITTEESIAKLLLLNIARARANEPVHFTGISNVAATYKFTAGGGVTPAATGGRGFLPVPFLNGSVEASPTISISPMQGDELTQRLLTPCPEQKLTLEYALSAVPDERVDRGARGTGDHDREVILRSSAQFCPGSFRTTQPLRV